MVGFIIRNGRKMLGRWKIAISTGKAKKQEEYGKNDRKKQIKSQGESREKLGGAKMESQ